MTTAKINLPHETVSILTLEIKQNIGTLESGIDVGQGITVGPGKIMKKNKHRALNKRRA